MALYYVKSGGTATGDAGRETTARTGTWNASTADYYPTMYAGYSTPTTTPVAGDYILFSSNHSETNATTLDAAVELLFVSVDNANQENYLPGATIIDTNSTATVLKITSDQFFAGINATSSDNAVSIDGDNRKITIQDCTVKSGTGSDLVLSTSRDGARFQLTNVDLDCTGTITTAINARNGMEVIWNGGSWVGTGTPTNLFLGNGGNGGFQAELNGVELSAITGSLLGATEEYASDVCLLRLNNCRLNSGVTLHNLLASDCQRFEMYNCDDSTGGDFHRFYVASGSGTASNNDSTYVTATESWYEGSVKSSIEITTTAICGRLQPFTFELPAQYVDLSQAASNVLTLELTTDLTLTDTDIASFLVYPDGTTSVIANWVTSGKTVGTGNYGNDPLAAGTTLTTGSLGAGDWTAEPTSPNFYKMVLDTSGDAGRATAVSIRIEVYKASIAAGTLFIHPLIQVSAA